MRNKLVHYEITYKKKKIKPPNINNISWWANVLLNIFFIAFVTACIYPLLLVLAVSFTDNSVIFIEGYRLIPSAWSVQGYIFAFAAGNSIIRAYGVTIFVTAVGTISHVFLCSLYAYPLSRPEFRSRKVFMGILLIPMLFGGGLVPWFYVMTNMLHLRDNIWALILPVMFSSWNTIVLRTYMKNNIHNAIIESARIDGCSEFQTYLRIVMPLSKAGLAVIAFFVALAYWNDFWLSLMLIRDAELWSLQYLLYNIMARIQFLERAVSEGLSGAQAAFGELGRMPSQTTRMAMAAVSIGPIIMVYPFFQRFFVKGITIGSIKG